MKNKLIWLEILGFASIIALAWINAKFHFIRAIFGIEYAQNYHDAFVMSFFVMLMAIPTIIVIRNQAKKVRFLQGGFRLCSLCKDVKIGDKWMPIEAYLKNRSSFHTCPKCMAQAAMNLELMKRDKRVK